MVREQEPRRHDQDGACNGVEQANPVLEHPRKRHPHEAREDADTQGKGRGFDQPERDDDAPDKIGHDNPQDEQTVQFVLALDAKHVFASEAADEKGDGEDRGHAYE